VLPTLTVVDPLVAIVVGAVLLGEPVRVTSGGFGLTAAAGVAIAISTAYLARAPAGRR